MPFAFRPTALPEVVVVEPRVFRDERGWFLESYKRSDFERAGIPHEFRQDNHSASLPGGVLRGLHHQLPPHAQGKLVRCLAGAILDVAVDVRPRSPTYRRWVAETLTAQDPRMLWVPPGFAHGFCVTSEIAEVEYKCTDFYTPSAERGLIWNDPEVGIEWPAVTPILSARDQKHPTLAQLRTMDNALPAPFVRR